MAQATAELQFRYTDPVGGVWVPCCGLPSGLLFEVWQVDTSTGVPLYLVGRVIRCTDCGEWHRAQDDPA